MLIKEKMFKINWKLVNDRFNGFAFERCKQFRFIFSLISYFLSRHFFNRVFDLIQTQNIGPLPQLTHNFIEIKSHKIELLSIFCFIYDPSNKILDQTI